MAEVDPYRAATCPHFITHPLGIVFTYIRGILLAWGANKLFGCSFGCFFRAILFVLAVLLGLWIYYQTKYGEYVPK